MKNFADKVASFAVIAGIFVFIGFCVWWETAMWKECLTDHSFFYCARVLGH